MYGLDYSWGRPNLAEAVQAGYRFVVRYLSHPVEPLGKILLSDEREAIHAHGLDLALVWEYDARDAMGGWTSGQGHALAALKQAAHLGAPDDTVIYFAVDFDVQPNQLATVSQYFQGIANVLPAERVGVYGGLRVVTYLLDHGLANWAWQTYAWSHGVWDPRAQLHQYLNGQMIAGAECDLNRSITDHFGQWKADADMSFEEGDRANLQATDRRVREILLLGTAEFDDVPGEGPARRPWLVAELETIADGIDVIAGHLSEPPSVVLTDADRSSIAASVVDSLINGDAAQGFARLVAASVLDAMSTRLGQ